MLLTDSDLKKVATRVAQHPDFIKYAKRVLTKTRDQQREIMIDYPQIAMKLNGKIQSFRGRLSQDLKKITLDKVVDQDSVYPSIGQVPLKDILTVAQQVAAGLKAAPKAVLETSTSTTKKPVAKKPVAKKRVTTRKTTKKA